MPGALLAYINKDWAATLCKLPSSGTEAVAVFLFASYLLGSFAFLIGHCWTTGFTINRKATAGGQISELAKGNALSHRFWRSLAAKRWMFGENADMAVTQVERIKARALQGLSANSAINSFQWSKARLSEGAP